MDTHASIRISSERLGLYSRYIAEHGPRLLAAFPALSNNSIYWDELDQLFVALIVDRYEADTAFSFAHSLRRNIDHGIWRPVAYSFPPPSKRRAYSMAAVHRRLPVQGRVDVALLYKVLQMPGFSVAFRDLKGDAERVRQRLEEQLYSNAAVTALPEWVDVVDAGFFRDRTAFLVAAGYSPTAPWCPSWLHCSTAPPGSTLTPSCTRSPISTISSVQRWQIFTCRPGSTIRRACFFSA